MESSSQEKKTDLLSFALSASGIADEFDFSDTLGSETSSVSEVAFKPASNSTSSTNVFSIVQPSSTSTGIVRTATVNIQPRPVVQPRQQLIARPVTTTGARLVTAQQLSIRSDGARRMMVAPTGASVNLGTQLRLGNGQTVRIVRVTAAPPGRVPLPHSTLPSAVIGQVRAILPASSRPVATTTVPAARTLPNNAIRVGSNSVPAVRVPSNLTRMLVTPKVTASSEVTPTVAVTGVKSTRMPVVSQSVVSSHASSPAIVTSYMSASSIVSEVVSDRLSTTSPSISQLPATDLLAPTSLPQSFISSVQVTDSISDVASTTVADITPSDNNVSRSIIDDPLDFDLDLSEFITPNVVSSASDLSLLVTTPTGDTPQVGAVVGDTTLLSVTSSDSMPSLVSATSSEMGTSLMSFGNMDQLPAVGAPVSAGDTPAKVETSSSSSTTDVLGELLSDLDSKKEVGEVKWTLWGEEEEEELAKIKWEGPGAGPVTDAPLKVKTDSFVESELDLKKGSNDEVNMTLETSDVVLPNTSSLFLSMSSSQSTISNKSIKEFTSELQHAAVVTPVIKAEPSVLASDIKVETMDNDLKSEAAADKFIDLASLTVKEEADSMSVSSGGDVRVDIVPDEGDSEPVDDSDMDVFAQALLQLSEANKEAEEFEAQHRALHPSSPAVTSSSVRPPTSLSSLLASRNTPTPGSLSSYSQSSLVGAVCPATSLVKNTLTSSVLVPGISRPQLAQSVLAVQPRVMSPVIRPSDAGTKFVYVPTKWPQEMSEDDDIIDLPSSEQYILTSNTDPRNSSYVMAEKPKVTDIYAPPQPKPSASATNIQSAQSAYESFLAEREIHLKDPFAVDSSYARLPPARNPRTMLGVARQSTPTGQLSQRARLQMDSRPLERRGSVPTSMSSLLGLGGRQTVDDMAVSPMFRVRSRDTNTSLQSLAGTPRLMAGRTVIGMPGQRTPGLAATSHTAQPFKDIVKSATVAAGLNMSPFTPTMRMMPLDPVDAFERIQEEEEEDEELGHAETYNDYMPSKLKFGNRHPDPVVETSSLASVESMDIHYKLSIPEHIIDYGFLSALQLETIVYASQRHEIMLPSGERAGFLIGDGAGVGKGRTIAGIIYENYLLGRKRSLWLSVSNDLRVDAERDLQDIGASKIRVYPLNKFKYAKITSRENGKVKKGVIFATYSSLIGESQSAGKYKSRFKQLIHWMGRDFDGLIVFDECHRAKNLSPVGSSKPTKTGLTVLELQNALPNARVVYASATGASEPRNMAYMTRLGLWGTGSVFKDFNDFIQSIERRGVGAMELVAMDMKLRGMYIARQLSFKGVTFSIDEVPVDKEYTDMYNEAVKLWVSAREKFQEAGDLMDSEHRLAKTMWGQFWASHQRFFKYLCISAKVRHCVNLAKEAIRNDKCVVIGLQSTGEAQTLEQLDEAGEINDFISTAKGVLQSLVEKHFPAPDYRMSSKFSLKKILAEDSSDDDRSLTSSGAVKRKKPLVDDRQLKRGKTSKSSDESSSDEEKKVKDTVKEAEESEDGSEEEESEESSESEEESEMEDDDIDINRNPFADGSDSDEDPWIKRVRPKAPKASKKKKKKKKVKKEKPAKAAGGDEDKVKEKLVVKEEKRVKKDSSSDEEDYDAVYDKMLRAAGIRGGAPAKTESTAKYAASTTDATDRAIELKQSLLADIARLADKLPHNALDELIDELGGTQAVAEMTGRRGRIVGTDDGAAYESRSEADVPLEILNLMEKKRFMDGDKLVAIISEAASSGISLQADRRALNQKRRVHITLELPWSADRAIQQFGRSHRSNQVSAPEYVFLISSLAGERRFASTVARRLESLGALTHGDRRATETRDLSRFNIDNKFGRSALEVVMRSVLRMERPMAPPPADYPGHFFNDVKQALIGVGMISKSAQTGYESLDKDHSNMSKFLNRLLGIEVSVQNALFKYFNDTMTAVILRAKRHGEFDLGILDLGANDNAIVKREQVRTFRINTSGGFVKVELNAVVVERGMDWQTVSDLWHEQLSPDDGFYLSADLPTGNRSVMMAVVKATKKSKDKMCAVYKPNVGLQARKINIDEIKRNFAKVSAEEAGPWWQHQYDESSRVCLHVYSKGMCRKTHLGGVCEMGIRCRTYYVLSGSVLSVWTRVENILTSLPGQHNARLQIVRLRTEDRRRLVGVLIPSLAVDAVVSVLSSSA